MAPVCLTRVSSVLLCASILFLISAWFVAVGDVASVVVDPNGDLHDQQLPENRTVRNWNGSGLLTDPAKDVDVQQPARPLNPVQDHTASRVNYELFLPSGWSKPIDRRHLFPVLIFLHGRGESGSFDITNAQSLPLQLRGNASFAATCPFIVVVPQCPWECAEENRWLPKILQYTTDLISGHVIPNLGGDPTRLYLAGQSMGGHGAWTYAAQQRRLFAAVVVICGYAHPGEDAIIADRLRGDAVCIAHAANDIVIPVQASDIMVQYLRFRGNVDLLELRYDEAPGPPMPEYSHLTGHGSYELAFRENALYNWLLQHRCTTCGPSATRWDPLDVDDI